MADVGAALLIHVGVCVEMYVENLGKMNLAPRLAFSMCLVKEGGCPQRSAEECCFQAGTHMCTHTYTHAHTHVRRHLCLHMHVSRHLPQAHTRDHASLALLSPLFSSGLSCSLVELTHLADLGDFEPAARRGSVGRLSGSRRLWGDRRLSGDRRTAGDRRPAVCTCGPVEL